MPTKNIAALTIRDWPKITKKGRSEVALWLLHVINDLLEDPKEYSNIFRATYNATSHD